MLTNDTKFSLYWVVQKLIQTKKESHMLVILIILQLVKENIVVQLIITITVLKSIFG